MANKKQKRIIVGIYDKHPDDCSTWVSRIRFMQGAPVFETTRKKEEAMEFKQNLSPVFYHNTDVFFGGADITIETVD